MIFEIDKKKKMKKKTTPYKLEHCQLFIIVFHCEIEFLS